MRPMFKEELEMLRKEFNINLPDNCWYDRSRVIQFSKNGDRRVLGQLTTKTPYKISYKATRGRVPYEKDEVADFKTYLSTTSNYKQKIEKCIERFKSHLEKYPDHEVVIMNSTGKDSIVAEFVVSSCTYNYVNAFNNTSLETAITIKKAKGLQNLKIINPNTGFYNWIKKDGQTVPTRSVRNCCDIFKEGQIATHTPNDKKTMFVTGMRSAESKGREDYVFDMKSTKWNKEQQEYWLLTNAIVDLEDIDVWACILLEELDFNILYKMGYNRVGCIVACPQQQNYYTVLDNIYYKKARDRWENILRDKFIAQDGWSIYNCTIEEYIWDGWKQGMKKRTYPTQEVIKEFMEYKGIKDKSVAEKYFMTNCVNKCVSKKSRINRPKVLRVYEIALNLKLRGRNLDLDQFMCEECLAEKYCMTVEDLKSKVIDYKMDGCSLF